MKDAVSNILEQFNNRFGKYPKFAQFDQGTEFYNKEVKSLLNKHNIEFFSTYSDKKAAVVERFNRTLKALMWKYFYSASTYKWLDVLQDLTDNYNSSVNRSIKTTPDSVNESNWTKVWQTLFSHNLGKPSEPKFAVGESVIISKYKSVFTKGYEANFTEELFTVTEVYHGHPNTYTIKDSADEPIIGRFYEQELYSAEGREPDFRIEKVIRRRTLKGKKMALIKCIMEDYDDHDDIELEETEKSYPQYDDLNYDDLTTAFNELDTRVKDEAMYGNDPIVITNLKSELDYVKSLMRSREIVNRITESLEEIARLKEQETTFTEGNDGTVNISGPSGSTTAPGVDFVEDPNNSLPDVLDAFDESFDTNWDEIEARLEKLKKFSKDRLTASKKRDFENQVERVQAVARVIKNKEGLVLDPKNKYVRELIKRSSVRTLKDGMEVLDSLALREYKDLLKKIKEVPTDPDARITSDEDTREEPQFDTSDEEYADRENIELIDISAKLGDLPGLTMQENNELRGVLNPPDGSSIEGRTGPNGALQVQADYFNEAIGETVERATSAEGTTEYNSLLERIDSLKEARDRTLEQRTVEEAREAQLKDISRLRKFVKWLGEEKVGLTGIAISTAGLITTLLVHARGAIVKTAKVTGKVAKALANLAKKAGPILVPILNAIATALSWGAKGIAWLASHLWVLAVTAALIVYNYYSK
ncbi:integrase core domain-containing [Paramuricea clavata]|uniref:Integrase core domain-containing n=1 Tax=Paramuricea clavata TaxID=317549 RepID=A0A7D9DSV6_PARCT|nr:integrase core domain-containing [Paramuricea clavata]